MRTLCRLLIAFIFLWLAVSSASAQFRNTGRPNAWTTRTVSRSHEGTGTTYVRSVRVGRHETFDRVVFEFAGSMPNYHVEYLRGRFYDNEGGRQRIKIAGNAFVQVNLNLIPTDEEQMKLREQDSFIPKGRLKFRSVWELDEAGLFEGYYDFLLGLRARKPFRVSELSNPLRLVIDFRH
jgi:hypothetical protein